MPLKKLHAQGDLEQYDHWVKSHPDGTLWQSLEWKAYQEALGREVRIYREGESSALVVIDRTTFGWSTWDIPRGPLLMSNEKLAMSNFLSGITDAAKKEGALSLFFSPVTSSVIVHSSFLIAHSSRSEQPPATRLIDLRQTEEEILAQMKQKGRYNIRVAEKHGVRVEQSKDIDAFARLAAETARRDGFTAPPATRYRKFLSSLPGAFLLLAYAPNPNPNPNPIPIAGLLGTQWNGTAIYYYGASDYTHRALMAPYLLQWETMKCCKTQGCHTYDLLGITRPIHEQSSPSSGGGGACLSGRQGRGEEENNWAGISRFKEQFGGTVMEYPQEQQIVLKPWINQLLQLKRKFL